MQHSPHAPHPSLNTTICVGWQRVACLLPSEAAVLRSDVQMSVGLEAADSGTGGARRRHGSRRAL